MRLPRLPIERPLFTPVEIHAGLERILHALVLEEAFLEPGQALSFEIETWARFLPQAATVRASLSPAPGSWSGFSLSSRFQARVIRALSWHMGASWRVWPRIEPLADKAAFVVDIDWAHFSSHERIEMSRMRARRSPRHHFALLHSFA